MLDRAAATIRRYSMLPPGVRVGVAVSGGADSLALLHILRDLGQWRLRVLHVNHHLRGAESEADESFVRETAAALGLEIRVTSAPLDGSRNLEEAARDARLAAFREALASGWVDRVATGHTRSDQAETVLLRLLRGAGTAGLAGILPVTAEGLVRPLLDAGRDEVRAWLGSRGIAWRDDSSNLNLRFDRNRLRHGLLPQLAGEWNPNIETALSHMSTWARDEEMFWREEIGRREGELLVPDGEGLSIDAAALAALPSALARRLVRRALLRVRGDLRRIDFRHVEAVLELAGRTAGSGRLSLPGAQAALSFGRLHVAPPRPARNFCHPLSVPSTVTVLPGGSLLRVELIESSREDDCVYNSDVSRMEWTRVAGFVPLEVRNWRPGDRYAPAGRGERVLKLKDLFQQERIPSWQRDGWPVITGGGQILWSRRFGSAASCVAAPTSRSVWRVSESTQTPAERCGGSR